MIAHINRAGRSGRIIWSVGGGPDDSGHAGAFAWRKSSAPLDLEDRVDRRGAEPITAAYEGECSDRRVQGSVSVGAGGWWSAELAVATTGEQSALLTIERHGPLPEGAPVGEAVTLVIGLGEADAVVRLLDGIIAQARRDGILRDTTVS